MNNEPTNQNRTGACRECLQKHLLKAEGYAEDHASALVMVCDNEIEKMRSDRICRSDF